ncbi:hypothetical protein L249_8896 [Ophiocordyceps polyrhachis-furcata BCC 54312]|uniref:Uncharacterized protein n=1 Tax=Ophiocordyceps polyrhachis-furcata BCC 54312 TaxID=1330021 RepID=A0A367L1Q9_9HYPO|nr:hypothetical protein L249_8896 [Ophiocordyceps polyrhachis-furcata BCC 54312]
MLSGLKDHGSRYLRPTTTDTPGHEMRGTNLYVETSNGATRQPNTCYATSASYDMGAREKGAVKLPCLVDIVTLKSDVVSGYVYRLSASKTCPILSLFKMHLPTFVSLFFAIGALSGPTAKTLSANAQVVATAFNASRANIIAIQAALEGFDGRNKQAFEDAVEHFFATMQNQTEKVQRIDSLTVDDVDNVLENIRLFTNELESVAEHRPPAMAGVMSVIEANGLCDKFYKSAERSTREKDAFVAALSGKIPREVMFPVCAWELHQRGLREDGDIEPSKVAFAVSGLVPFFAQPGFLSRKHVSKDTAVCLKWARSSDIAPPFDKAHIPQTREKGSVECLTLYPSPVPGTDTSCLPSNNIINIINFMALCCLTANHQKRLRRAIFSLDPALLTASSKLVRLKQTNGRYPNHWNPTWLAFDMRARY